MLSRVARTMLALSLLLGVVTALTVQTTRAAFFSGDTVYVSTDYLNLRSNPGTDGTIRDLLIFGDKLTIIEGPSSDDGYLWYKVLAVNINLLGWVTEDYIGLSESGDGGSTGFEDALGVRVTDGPINIRESPGTTQPIVGTLSEGAEVPVRNNWGDISSRDGYDWIAISFGNGTAGFVATAFLTPLDYSPNLGSDDGWGNANGVEVVDGPVNRRSTPSVDGAIIDTLPTGFISASDPDTMKTADGYTWIEVYRLNSGTKWGWVAIDFLSPLDESPCPDGPCYPPVLSEFFDADTVVVGDGPVNMRAEPTTSSEILLTLQDGDYIFDVDLIPASVFNPVFADGYYWLYGTAGDVYGWTAIDFLDPVD